MTDSFTYLMDREYAVRTSYTAAGMPEYVGWAVAGTGTGAAGWRIQKIEYDANNRVVSVKWGSSNGKPNSRFDKVWDDRGTLTYE